MEYGIQRHAVKGPAVSRPSGLGERGMIMNLVDDSDEIVACPPATCHGCGADLSPGAGRGRVATPRYPISAPASAPRGYQVLGAGEGVR
jgi:hypothetical protein